MHNIEMSGRLRFAERRRLSFDWRRWKMTPVWVGSIAQRLEQGTHNPLVEGSNPSGPNLFHCGGARQTCEQHSRCPSHSRVVDKGREKIKKIKGHPKQKGVEYRCAYFFVPFPILSDALHFPVTSPRKRSRNDECARRASRKFLAQKAWQPDQPTFGKDERCEADRPKGVCHGQGI